MSRSYIFSSESVGEGHPDKVCDTISDAVLDACLAADPRSRVACETYAKSNIVVVGGEITTAAKVDYDAIVRRAVRDIGYVNDDDVFHADRLFLMNIITSQSPDIAQGVDEREAEGKGHAEQGAGDQGLMFGYACDETPELMPAPIMFAHRLGREVTRRRKGDAAAGLAPVEWLRPDAKSQVSVRYEEDGGSNGGTGGRGGVRLKEITNVVISTQHAESVKHATIKEFMVEEVIKRVLPAELLTANTQFLINPTGRFVIGGPQGDTGLTGRKIIVDTYGGMGRHGGGAFSGKDPSKVDRSAAYMGRYVAKNVVAAGLARRCEVQFAYAIGYPEPVSVHIDTFGTNTVAEEKIERAVKAVFSFKPARIVEQLDLLRPIYGKTTNYGHFGKIDDLAAITWEKADKVEALKGAL